MRIVASCLAATIHGMDIQKGQGLSFFGQELLEMVSIVEKWGVKNHLDCVKIASNYRAM